MEFQLALAGLILSFFFAGSEAAYMAFNNLRLDLWERQNKPFARSARKFTEHPENFYSTILLGNNVANITYSTFATVLLIHYMDETLAFAMITSIVLFFGEIFPKMLFRSYANRIILKVLILVRIFYLASFPFVKFVNRLITLFYRLLGMPTKTSTIFFSRDELQVMLEEEVESNDFRQKYIANVLGFSSVKVTEAMTPRTEIAGVTTKTSWDDVLDIMIASGRNTIPVYKDSIDNIIGAVYLFDMLEPLSQIETVVKPIEYVPETKKCSELLREFQEHNTSLAVVVDEYGGTEGLVATDDLIEILFGEFLEPYEQVRYVKALNERTWLIDARVYIEDLADQIGIPFPDGDFETLAGLILDRLGQIPKIGDTLECENFRIEIIEASPKKIYKVKLIRKISV